MRGLSASPHDTPTPSSASIPEPRLQHRGGKGVFCTKRPYPTPTVQTHTPGSEGEARRKTPTFHAAGLRREAPREAGAPAPGDEGAAPQPRPPRWGAESEGLPAKEGIQSPSFAHRVLRKPDPPPPPRPSKKREQWGAASPAIPAPRAAGGGNDAISPHTPTGNTPPAPGPPSAARCPTKPTRVSARRSRALRLPARPTHRLLLQPGTPLAAARPRLRYKPPRPPAPPHNMASLGFRNGAREIQQGPLNIHERLRGSRRGRRCGEGGKERASKGAEARDGGVHGAGRPAVRGEGVPPRAGLEDASRPSQSRPAPPPRRPPRGRRSPRATPGCRRRRFVLVVLPSWALVPLSRPTRYTSLAGCGGWSSEFCPVWLPPVFTPIPPPGRNPH